VREGTREGGREGKEETYPAGESVSIAVLLLIVALRLVLDAAACVYLPCLVCGVLLAECVLRGAAEASKENMASEEGRAEEEEAAAEAKSSGSGRSSSPAHF